MFKNLIYFDSNKVAEYGAVLEGKKHVSIKSVKVNSGKSLSAKVPMFSGGINGSNEMEGEIVDNLILDCNEFEDLLDSKSKDNYFDFLENECNVPSCQDTKIQMLR